MNDQSCRLDVMVTVTLYKRRALSARHSLLQLHTLYCLLLSVVCVYASSACLRLSTHRMCEFTKHSPCDNAIQTLILDLFCSTLSSCQHSVTGSVRRLLTLLLSALVLSSLPPFLSSSNPQHLSSAPPPPPPPLTTPPSYKVYIKLRTTLITVPQHVLQQRRQARCLPLLPLRLPPAS